MYERRLLANDFFYEALDIAQTHLELSQLEFL